MARRCRDPETVAHGVIKDSCVVGFEDTAGNGLIGVFRIESLIERLTWRRADVLVLRQSHFHVERLKEIDKNVGDGDESVTVRESQRILHWIARRFIQEHERRCIDGRDKLMTDGNLRVRRTDSRYRKWLHR